MSKIIRQKLRNDHVAFLAAATGFGKCFHPDQKLILANRNLKRAADVIAGDLLLGDDHFPRVVTSTITGVGEMVEVLILPSRTVVLRSNTDHILCLVASFAVNLKAPPVIEISVKEYLALPPDTRAGLRLYSKSSQGGWSPPSAGPNSIKMGLSGMPLSSKEYREWSVLDFHSYVRHYFMGRSNEGSGDRWFFIEGIPLESLESFKEAARRAGVLTTMGVVREKEVMWIDPTGFFEFEIVSVGEGHYSGFTVSGTNQRFFLDNGIITHNTTIGCEIAARSGVKVAFLCFLDIVLDQWVKALETKTTGKVQKVTGKVLDPEADFYVMGVLKASKMSRASLEEVGGVVLDEAHITVKETFEGALLKFQPLWVLGLSATPRRPDGLHSVLEMYFGDKENFVMRKETKPFTAYKIETNFIPEIRYISRQGKRIVDWGLVISSLAESPERQKFIVNRLVKVLEDPSERILILTLRVDEGREVAEVFRKAFEEGRVMLREGEEPVMEIFGKQPGVIAEGTHTLKELKEMRLPHLKKLAGLNKVSLGEGKIKKETLVKTLAKVYKISDGSRIIEARGGIRAINREGKEIRYTKIPPEVGFYRVQIVGMKKGGVGYDDPTRTSEALLDSVREVEQYEGRVRMQDCSIYDFVDDFGALETHWNLREKHYRTRGAEIVVEKSAKPRNTKPKAGRKVESYVPSKRFGR